MATFAINGGKIDAEGHGKPWISFFRPGVIRGGAVTQRGAGANMSVDVGIDSENLAAFLVKTSANVGYIGYMDAITNVSVNTPDPTNPRKDRLVAFVDVSLITASTTNNAGALKFKSVAGTPDGSPTEPSDVVVLSSVGAGNPWTELALIDVGAAAPSIVNPNITYRGTTSSLRTAGTLFDTNSNELVKFSSAASAVNEITVSNANTGGSPTIEATGGDTNISLVAKAKGNAFTKVSTFRQDQAGTNTYHHNTVRVSGHGTIVAAASGVATEAFSFGVTFASIPIVTVSFAGDAASGSTGLGQATAFRKFASAGHHTDTTTGSTVRIVTLDGTSWTSGDIVHYTWTAEGQI